MYLKGKDMLARPLYKTLMIIFVVAVCFVFAYIKDASASEYGNLSGNLLGRKWQMGSVTLKKKIEGNMEVVVLEISDSKLSDSELCQESKGDVSRLLAKIPLTLENGLKIPVSEAADFRMNGSNDMNIMNCFHEIELNAEELNSGSAFVSGRLELVSGREKTEIKGYFKARVCN